MIHIISGGTTDGDSIRARKAHGRRLENFEVNSQLSQVVDPNISFGREDLRDVVVPHNDPLLVTLTIANYDVARIFVDTGSSVNIIFKETLDQMKLEGFELDPIITELYGFTGHALQPLGQIVLPLSLGNGEQRVTKMACFTVVDAPSSFNGILGRPALSDFRAVASTFHQKLKFPSGREVGVVRGDQKAAQLCYVNEVKIDAKKKRGRNGFSRPGPEGVGSEGATYQRLMDRVFASQISRNMKVYVDDILVKSQDDVGLVANLEETFSTLRTYRVKLNPENCVFGVRGCTFLGYMVTERGIEANPEKVQAIQSMSPPCNLQEVQRLAGRIAALSRFISRSAHRSLPFFKVLCKAKKFEWHDECEKEFDDLKNYLAELPCVG
ncbi:uncharacterized protein [Henckelia pumila]|uniref:uncharacterized protein n=1 Tax=Henckelia pumila TaxID=405737 RepID=UPI003C6E5955